jgi:archaellum component FlaC
VALVCALGVSRADAGQPSDVLATHAQDQNNVSSRFEHIDRTLTRMEPAVSAAQEMVRSLLNQIQKWADPAVRQTLAKLTEEQEALQKQYEQLGRQVAELKQALESRQKETPAQSRAELERSIQKAVEEQQALAKKLKELEARRNTAQSNMGVQQKITKKPKYVLIYRDRVVPMEEPYYITVSRGTVGGIPARKVKRVKDGEPVSQAISPGGCLAQILSALGPNECISFQVCGDSIAAFRMLVEHVRSRKITYTWEPEEDKDFIFGGAGAGGGGYGEDSR